MRLMLISLYLACTACATQRLCSRESIESLTSDGLIELHDEYCGEDVKKTYKSNDKDSYE